MAFILKHKERIKRAFKRSTVWALTSVTDDQ